MMKIKNKNEADWLNQNVLHCGYVRPGDVWDSPQAWEDHDDRNLAREILRRYRQYGETAVVTDDERRQLAVCCREAA